MTDRPTLDQMNSDDLDALYAERDMLRRNLRRARSDAEIHASLHAHAEAVLARVRQLVTGAAHTTAAGISDYDIGRHELAREVLAALDAPSGPAATQAADDEEQQ